MSRGGAILLISYLIPLAVVPTAVRLPLLLSVPRFTDETDEVMRGYAIYRGELWPVTNVDAYVGPLWNYLLAGAFMLLGPSSRVPRGLVFLAGVATVAVTYLLARELARRAGISGVRITLVSGLATMLMATSAVHSVVSSHVAWSHSLTPLLVTLGLWLLLRSGLDEVAPSDSHTSGPSGRDVVGAGLLLGLGVHTHPTVLALVPGIAVWAVLRGRGCLRRGSTWLGVAAFLAANAPAIAFNLATGFQSFAEAQTVGTAYAGGRATDMPRYVQNLGLLLTSVPLLLGGGIGDRRGDFVGFDPILTALYGLPFLWGTVLCWRDGARLPAFAFGALALVLPAFNGKYEPLLNGRYLMPLVPLATVCLAMGAVDAVTRARAVRGLRVLASGLPYLLMLLPTVSLAFYYRAVRLNGPSNDEWYAARDLVVAARPRSPILVDASISGTRVSSGRDGYGVLDFLLVLDGGLRVERVLPADLDRALSASTEPRLAALSSQAANRLSNSYRLRPVPGEEQERPKRRAGFGLWWVER
ncbi:MAG: glycosyltransferase family 39 protein [Chloroflexota bacterium]